MARRRAFRQADRQIKICACRIRRPQAPAAVSAECMSALPSANDTRAKRGGNELPSGLKTFSAAQSRRYGVAARCAVRVEAMRAPPALPRERYAAATRTRVIAAICLCVPHAVRSMGADGAAGGASVITRAIQCAAPLTRYACLPPLFAIRAAHTMSLRQRVRRCAQRSMREMRVVTQQRLPLQQCRAMRCACAAPARMRWQQALCRGRAHSL